MSIIKLEVAKPVTLHIDNVEHVEGQFGPQTKFSAAGGDCLFLARTTADRQMERIGDVHPGDVLRFEKVQKGTKTFVNIDRVNGNGGASGPTNARQGVPVDTPTTPPAPPVVAAKPKASGHELYEKITDYVLGTIKPKYDKAGIGLSPESAAAICATLYIGAQKNGH